MHELEEATDLKSVPLKQSNDIVQIVANLTNFVWILRPPSIDHNRKSHIYCTKLSGIYPCGLKIKLKLLLLASLQNSLQ